MALGTSNISISLVKSTISDSNNALSALCTSNNINEWSKYKPVRGSWPQSTNNFYGFELPQWTNGTTTFATSNWNYLKPTTEYRLGDFRGYEHNPTLTMPVAYAKSADQDENPVLSPSQPPGGASSGTATGKFSVSTSTVRPTVTDYGFNNYYFGILMFLPNNTRWIKTNTTALGSSSETTGLSVFYSATIDLTEPVDPDALYQDLPSEATPGNYTANYVISSVNYSTWTKSPAATIYRLPVDTINSIPVKTYYVFIIQEWVYPSVQSMSFNYAAAGASYYQSSKIYCSDGAAPFVKSADASASWITSVVYDTSDTGNISNPSLWTNGCWVRVYPTTANNGYAKVGTLYIGGTGAADFPITLTHQAAPAEVLPTAGDPDVMTVSATSGNVTGGLNFSFTPHYVPNDDPTFTVQYRISITHYGVTTYTYSSGSGGGSATLISCTQDQAKNVANLYYGSTTWVDGDDINIELYYELAPGIE